MTENTPSNRNYRALPSVDRLLQAAELRPWLGCLPQMEIVAMARQVLADARTAIRRGDSIPTLDMLADRVAQRVARLLQPQLRPLINATGVINQTNLGRAPLSPAALQALTEVGRGYSNLEYDLERGERGSRYDHMSATLARLTGADAALVVNNNAAAVFFVLTCFCAGREVIVSRGQAVEIGGGFRIPDVLRESGATLVEVGTTNRTYVRDYAAAITERTAAILTVHRSNFQIVGFTHDPDEQELQALARERGILWIDDWGSGSLLRPGDFGLTPEAAVPDRIAAGCDLVCFSGDKLLGGPQAGIIAGKAPLIAQLRRHPLLRALRVDKLIIAAMEATLLSYIQGRAVEDVPIWRMVTTSVAALRERADRLVDQLERQGVVARAVACESAIGGGAVPGQTLPSVGIAIDGEWPDLLHRLLRQGDPPIIGRITGGSLLLDLRTVLPADDERLPKLILAGQDAAIRQHQERT